MPFNAEWYADMRSRIDEKYRSDLAALDRVYQLSQETTDPPAETTVTAVAAPATNGHDSEVFALLDAGKSMKEISQLLGLNYNRVYSIKAHWEHVTGKDYHDTVKRVAVKPAEAVRLPDPPRNGPGREVVIAPKPSPPKPAAVLKANEEFFEEPDRRGSSTIYTDTQIAEFVRRVEEFISVAGPLPYSRVLAGAGLSPHQFNECIRKANVEKIDGQWQTKATLTTAD